MEIRDEKLKQIFLNHKPNGTIYYMAKSKGYFAIAVEQNVLLFDLNSSSLIHEFNQNNSCTSVLFYLNFITFVSGYEIFIFDLQNLELVKHHEAKTKDANIWMIQNFNRMILYPTNSKEMIVYNVETQKFESIMVEIDEGNYTFMSSTIFNKDLYISAGNKMYIRDINDLQTEKKEIYFDQGTTIWGTSSNSNNVFLSFPKEIIVFNDELIKLYSIDFSNTRVSPWLTVVNDYIICGSTWGSWVDVLTFNLVTKERIIIPNSKNHRFWCVLPFEEDDYVLLGHTGGIIEYQLDLNRKKLQFNGRNLNFSNIYFSFK